MNDDDIEVFWYDLVNTAGFNRTETINCGVVKEDAQRHAIASINVVATRLNGEIVLVHLSPTDAELTRIIHGLEEARARVRRYRGEEVPIGARLLALSDIGRAYLHNGRLVVEAPGARLELEPVDLDVLSEIDALVQAAGDFIAEGNLS